MPEQDDEGSDQSTATTMDASDSDFSFDLEDALSDNETEKDCEEQQAPARPPSVTFDTQVRVREHNVAIGDHPMTMFPITLAWESAPERLADIAYAVHSRRGRYVPPHQLSLAERKERLLKVNASFDDSQRQQEIDDMIQNAWEAEYISPALY
jgi:hypothetical protein